MFSTIKLDRELGNVVKEIFPVIDWGRAHLAEEDTQSSTTAKYLRWSHNNRPVTSKDMSSQYYGTDHTLEDATFDPSSISTSGQRFLKAIRDYTEIVEPTDDMRISDFQTLLCASKNHKPTPLPGKSETSPLQRISTMRLRESFFIDTSNEIVVWITRYLDPNSIEVELPVFPGGEECWDDVDVSPDEVLQKLVQGFPSKEWTVSVPPGAQYAALAHLPKNTTLESKHTEARGE